MQTLFSDQNAALALRSRHESLVAVSNRQFYNNRLLLYPSPIQDSEDLGLHLVHLPHTVYDRGAGQTNRIESKTIAEKAVEHYRKHPQTSLGIGSFNIKQQQAILEEIELQLRQYPEMEEYFKSDRFDISLSKIWKLSRVMNGTLFSLAWAMDLISPASLLSTSGR
jgi:hypothetical protein